MAGTQTLYRRDAEHFQQIFPKHTEQSQHLSTSETLMLTEVRISAQTKFDSEIVPGGWPVQDKEILLWDEENRSVAAGEIGQIVVRSRYLAAYWRQPVLSAAKFRPDPAGEDGRIYLSGDLGRWRPDGMLEHLGRKDNMVKVRGYTVQLEAVESALRELPGVRDAACAVQSSRSGEQSLVAYLVPNVQPALTMAEMRQGLATMLPNYMIPTAMMTLAALPQTAAGKINRKPLQAPW
jgi:acyl-coenzyme A synthetase/AMP-(fatty) acid ligase